MNLRTFTLLLFIATAKGAVADNMLGFDIYGDSSKFDPSDSITVDPDTCEYHAEVHINFGAADPPFPSNPEEDCSTLDSTACNGQSCLYEVRNVYKLSKAFRKYTGFNHVGLDWSPCGHPPIENFGRPHWNMHIFRVSPKSREEVFCEDMPNPFICEFVEEQPNIEGRKFFVHGTDKDGNLANVPSSFSAALDTAVPGEGVHAWDFENTAEVSDWDKPLLIEGLYDGGIQFWEPMFPVEFVTGDSEKFYESTETYVSQTIVSLPSYWSMAYNPDTGVTTLVLEGKAQICPKKSKGGKAGKARRIRK